MLFRLFLLFVITPVLELALLIQAGQWLGVLPTVAIVIATGAAGASLARMQGLLALRRLQQALAHGAFPGDEIFDGLLILFGGVLLLTPGFVTDLVGFCALVPGSRGVLKEFVKREVHRRLNKGALRVQYDVR